MVDHKDIGEFIRKTLGCTCPDEVFQHIECQTALSIEDNLVLDYEINVGNRLLIYATGITDTDSLGPMLSRLVRTGKHKRDKDGFNRLRLVLLTQKPTVVAKEASDIFQTLDTTDEKVHLHVIDKEDFPIGRGQYQHKSS
jgi:hypothetical protein